MSVLSRHRTIPSPRTSDDAVIDLDAPALRPSSEPASSNPSSNPSRTLLLLSGAAVFAAAAVGTTVYVLADDAPSPTRTVDLPFSSELKRDAAAAARNGAAAAVAKSEAQRDAAAAARHASG